MALSFFATTIGVSAIVLVVFVVAIVVITYTESTKRRYAPGGPSLCPDRWSRLSTGACQVDASNQGDLPNGFTSLFTGKDWMGPARKQWAQTHRIRWDGL